MLVRVSSNRATVMRLSVRCVAPRLAVAAVFALGLGLVDASGASAASTDQATAYQLDPAHDGYQTASAIMAPLTQAWSDTLSSPVSYPLVANGVVYVIAGGTTLYAIDQATGATLWSHSLGGTYGSPGPAYDAGQVFAVTSGGEMTAFNAASGAIDWSTALPGQYMFTSPPTAAGGYVYVGGAGTGGTLYAVSEATGSLAWRASVANGDHSSPAVDSTGVYVTYAGGEDAAFDPLSGGLLWHDDLSGTEGGGGKTPVLANGQVFGRDSAGNAVLSESTGATLGSFASTTAPAVGGGQAYMVSGGTLTAVADSGLGTNAWSFAGDSGLDTAPVIVGNLVFEGSSSGEVYALNTSGTSVWSANAGSAIPAPDEQNAVSLTGLGAGEGTLIVPASGRLVAYAGANVSLANGTPTNSSAPTVTGTPYAGQAVGADVGSWSPLPSSYTYQWSICNPSGGACATIPGATGESYTPTSAELDSTLEVSVTATSAANTSTAVTSVASPAIAGSPADPINLTAPTISGNPVAGDTLTASPGTWTRSPTRYDFQWFSCDTSLTDCTSVGTDQNTYASIQSDLDHEIVVEVDATSSLAVSSPSLSSAVGPIAEPPIITPMPIITPLPVLTPTAALTPSPTAAPTYTSPNVTVLTRTEKLAKALKACTKLKAKHGKRAACLARATKRYGPKKIRK